MTKSSSAAVGIFTLFSDQSYTSLCVNNIYYNKLTFLSSRYSCVSTLLFRSSVHGR